MYQLVLFILIHSLRNRIIEEFEQAIKYERKEKEKHPMTFEQNWGIEDGLGCAHHALRNYQ